MSTRVLLVEPDATARALSRRVLVTAGHYVEDFASVYDARRLLDEGTFEVAVVDELSNAGLVLDEVAYLRREHPRIAVVVTGTVLTASVLLELLRLGACNAVAKPFTPDELRAAVQAAALTTGPHRDLALDVDAALRAARIALAGRDTATATRVLARAHALAPLDPEAIALEALRAEIEGSDVEARRAYAAALALSDDAAFEGPPPYDGIARLALYDGARPVDSLPASFAHASIRLVTDPRHAAPADPAEHTVSVLVSGLPCATTTVIAIRIAGRHAFVLVAGDTRAERLAPLLASLGDGVFTSDDGVDVEHVVQLRDASRATVAVPATAGRR